MTSVLFLQGTADRAGAEAVLEALVAGLPDHDVHPTVAVAGEGALVRDLRDRGVTVEALPPLPRLRDAVAWRRQPARWREIVDEVAPDVVVGVSEKMSLLALRASDRPVVAWLHDAPRRSIASTMIEAGVRALRPAAYVVPSAWMAAAYGRLAPHARVVPNGLELAELEPPKDPRTLCGWGPDTAVVTFAGRLERWKAPDLFIDAAARVAERHERARFLLLGGALYGRDREFADGLGDRASARRLGDRLLLAGHRPDARALLGGSVVVVHCSRRPEPFGMVIAEAMAHGRPVVAADLGATPELVTHGSDGLLFEADSVSALAGAIDGLLRDDELRGRLGDAAGRVASERFDAAVMCGRFANLLDEVASGQRPASTSS